MPGTRWLSQSAQSVDIPGVSRATARHTTAPGPAAASQGCDRARPVAPRRGEVPDARRAASPRDVHRRAHGDGERHLREPADRVAAGLHAGGVDRRPRDLREAPAPRRSRARPRARRPLQPHRCALPRRLPLDPRRRGRCLGPGREPDRPRRGGAAALHAGLPPGRDREEAGRAPSPRRAERRACARRRDLRRGRDPAVDGRGLCDVRLGDGQSVAA